MSLLPEQIFLFIRCQVYCYGLISRSLNLLVTAKNSDVSQAMSSDRRILGCNVVLYLFDHTNVRTYF